MIGRLGYRHGVDWGVVNTTHGDADGIVIGERTAAACVALVVGDDLHTRGAVVACRGIKHQAIQRRINIRHSTGERHSGISGAIAGGEAQARDPV
ncbi:MAG: hypothetical protein E2O38_12160 [Proteobacteria bacterium]|nr:MAG: hypothetical protein E2O38_12160 [Pseudomonadota bacterium]